MSWVMETTGEATCMNDYISKNAPVVELLLSEDLALALAYLDPTLSRADIKSLYKKGEKASQYCGIDRILAYACAQRETQTIEERGHRVYYHLALQYQLLIHIRNKSSLFYLQMTHVTFFVIKGRLVC